MQTMSRALCFSLVMWLAAAHAEAQTASFSGEATAYGNVSSNLFGPSIFLNVNGSDGLTGTVSSHAASSPTPSPNQEVSTTLSVTLPPEGYASYAIGGANATTSYYFRVVGPSDTMLPIMVAANGNISISPNSAGLTEVHAFASLKVGEMIDDTISANFTSAGLDPGIPVFVSTGHTTLSGRSLSGPIIGTINEDNVYEFETNTYYNVSLNTAVYGNIYASNPPEEPDGTRGPIIPGGTLNLSAGLDPVFSFANAPDGNTFALEFSPGIGNSPGSPAGAPAPLAGAGLFSFLGAAGVAGWKRAKRMTGSLLSRWVMLPLNRAA